MTKMEQLIRKDYRLRGMQEQVQKWLQNCVSCILAERKHGKPEGFQHSMNKGEGLVDTYHVDHLGPLASTEKSYINYILAFTDAITKFVWLYPTKTTSSAEAIKKLLRQSAGFRNPRCIIFERSTGFTPMEFKKYWKEEGITHTTILIGIPRRNRQVLRPNRTLSSILSKLATPSHGDWHKFVYKAQQYIIHIPTRSTGVLLFTLLFETRMKLRGDLMIIEIIEEEQAALFLEKRDAFGDSSRVCSL